MSLRCNVLVVDDRESNRIALAALLEPLHEHVVSLDSGDAALRFLLKGEAAVILLDVDMPGLDGFETAKLIRSRERTRNVPIVFVTAFDGGQQDMARGYELGAVDYIVKPVHPEVLRAKVAVFVELFHHHREKVRTLEEELKAERDLVGAWQTRDRMGPSFSGSWQAGLQRSLERDFRALLRAQIDRDEEEPREQKSARQLAQRIAVAGGGPRELLALHRNVTEEIMAAALPQQGRVLRDRCRLLSLELMGHLVEFFRSRVPRQAEQQPEPRQGRAPERRSL